PIPATKTRRVRRDQLTVRSLGSPRLGIAQVGGRGPLRPGGEDRSVRNARTEAINTPLIFSGRQKEYVNARWCLPASYALRVADWQADLFTAPSGSSRRTPSRAR